MYSANIDIQRALSGFTLKDTMFTYNSFMARLYNYCKTLGFESGKILPSRAFCSDENQGYPIILIAKHFGTFPFNHGRVGSIVSTDRHGPHAEHGKDLMIIHASHVGYNPQNRMWGNYHRRHTEDCEETSSCGRIQGVLEWYLCQYTLAKANIFLDRHGDEYLVNIDNQILNERKTEGLFVHLKKMIAVQPHGEFRPLRSQSTSKCYRASQEFRALIGDDAWGAHGPQAIGDKLLPELFGFKRHISGDPETHGLLEENLILPMPWIVASEFPLLTAAQANTQVEFDRTYQTLVNSKAYHGKRVVFISGLNIDISPNEDQLFPLTKFSPWAAFVQERNGHRTVLEQDELMKRLLEQSEDNPDEVHLEDAIHQMKNVEEITIRP